jgi:crotonobetainyl-CoA:carnitine CoA-transferase CaiB-like acyl-CoA transferase
MILPLEGVRILTLAEQYPGPFATLVAADLGAEVIIVERGSGDPARQFDSFHAALNRNKKSVVLDLKTENGKEVLRELIRETDVLMEGYRPGTMKRLGFDYSSAAAINPRIVYLSISGFGQTGPYRDRPAHDLSYQALAGLLFRQADTSQPEAPPDLAIGDLSSAMFALTGMLSGLLQRERTGRGTYVDVSMTDCLVSWMTTILAPQMNGTAAAFVNDEPGYGIFKCADGKLLTLSVAHEDWFWQPLCALLEMGDAASLDHHKRVSQQLELRLRIAERLLSRPRHAWAVALDQAGIPWGPVNSLDEVAADEHFRQRGMFRQVASKSQGASWHVAQPLVFDGERPVPLADVPPLGGDTESILAHLKSQK